MKEYILEIIEQKSYLFTKEEFKIIKENISLIIKIFRLGVIDEFNMQNWRISYPSFFNVIFNAISQNL